MLHGIVLELTALTRRQSSVLAFLTNHDARKSRLFQCTQHCLDRTRSFKIPFPLLFYPPLIVTMYPMYKIHGTHQKKLEKGQKLRILYPS